MILPVQDNLKNIEDSQFNSKKKVGFSLIYSEIQQASTESFWMQVEMVLYAEGVK